MRYFNHILVSDCCRNYICRLCIGWQAKRAKRDPNYRINCSHCYKDEFRLCDVDEEADDFELRHYTDTPLKFLQEMEKRMEADKVDQAVADLELCDSACEITLRKQVDKHVQEHSTPVAVDGPEDDK